MHYFSYNRKLFRFITVINAEMNYCFHDFYSLHLIEYICSMTKK